MNPEPKFFSLSALNLGAGMVAIVIVYRLLLITLGLESIGLWSATLAVCSVVRIADIGLGARPEKVIAAYAARREIGRIALVIETAMVSVGGVVIVVSLVMFPISKLLLRYVLSSECNVSEVVQVLPYALFSTGLGVMANLLQSALGGLNRVNLRMYTSVAGTALLVVFAWVLVRRHGLIGLALSQMAQALFLWGSSWILIRREHIKINIIPANWSRSIFSEMRCYGAFSRITAIGALIMESAAKLLMVTFGGLSVAAYFEMASQLVRKFHRLLVSANPSLVPGVAGAHAAGLEKAIALHLLNYRCMFLVSLPFWALTALSMPYVSLLWIGSFSWGFVLFGWLLVLGWGMNSIGVPVYGVSVVSGRSIWKAEWVPRDSMAVVRATGIGLVVCGAFSAMVISAALLLLDRSSGLTIQGLGLYVTVLIFTVMVGPFICKHPLLKVSGSPFDKGGSGDSNKGH